MLDGYLSPEEQTSGGKERKNSGAKIPSWRSTCWQALGRSIKTVHTIHTAVQATTCHGRRRMGWDMLTPETLVHNPQCVMERERWARLLGLHNSPLGFFEIFQFFKLSAMYCYHANHYVIIKKH